MNVKNKIRMVDWSLKGDKSFGSQEVQEPTPMVIIILIDIFMVKFFFDNQWGTTFRNYGVENFLRQDISLN